MKILLKSALILSLLLLSACSSTNTASSNVSDTKTLTSQSETVESNFVAVDTSDETIESMVTYNDYLDMCQKILDDYYTNYQNVISGTVLDDCGATMETIKEQNEEAFEEQKSEYASLGDAKLVEKEALVQYLESYRDGLQAYIDSIAQSIQ